MSGASVSIAGKTSGYTSPKPGGLLGAVAAVLMSVAACTGTVSSGAPSTTGAGTGAQTGPAGGAGTTGAGLGGGSVVGPGTGGAASGTGAITGTGAVTGTGATTGTGGTIGGGAGAGAIVIPSTPPAAVLVPTARMARLSHAQWANTVKDLLKLADISDIEPGVTGDAVVGFDNDVESLFVAEALRADLATAAVKLAQKVAGDTAALTRLMPANAPTDLAGKARSFITTVGQRAYRRPLAAAETTEATTLFNQGPTLYPGVDAFAAGANLVLQFFLQSPHFLYRSELSTAVVNGRVPLNDYEVASKLSYALGNTMPDDTLFAAAAAGQLKMPANVVAQATRILTSELGAAGRDHLHFQVLRLGTYDGITRDQTAFPDFTTATPAAMRQESLSFLRWIFDQGYGVKQIYTAPVGFVNKVLAPIYQVTGTFTDQFTKVDLDPARRSGLLTQAGFLSSYAIGNDPDSIHRGVFVNQRILCFNLPPPAANATPLVAPQPDQTNRERIEATTGNGTCGQGCHSTWINTAGFAFEAFDAIGKFRTMDRGKPINSADTYPFTDGAKSYTNAVEFSKAVSESTQAHACYTRNWLTYINGRPVAPAEAPLADYWALVSRAGQLSMKDMILAMVTSETFVNRLP